MGEHRSREWYNNEFKQGVSQFDTAEIFVQRAEIISNWAVQDGIGSVFEFAAGGCVLAQTIVRKVPDIRYVWSDFSVPALENARRNAQTLDIRDIDIEIEYPHVPWETFEGVICVSWEHLEKDREIMEAIPSGKPIHISCPTIDAPDHLRVLANLDEVAGRYGHLIEIQEFVKVDILQLVRGKRK